VTPELAALAAVARCKLQAARAAAAAPASSAGGPWAIPDAKRLWLPHVKQLAMEAGEGGARGARLEAGVAYLSDTEFEVGVQGGPRGGGRAGGAGRGGVHSGGAAAPCARVSAPPSLLPKPATPCMSRPAQVTGCSPAGPLRVSHVSLQPDAGAAAPLGAVAGGARVAGDGSASARVSCEVAGRRLVADALMYPHLDEEVLVVWADGHAHEFRWERGGRAGGAGARGALGHRMSAARPRRLTPRRRPAARAVRWEVPSWSKSAVAGATTGAVKTPMPGKLVKLLVAEGQVGGGRGKGCEGDDGAPALRAAPAPR
jgi:hypothetical protein